MNEKIERIIKTEAAKAYTDDQIRRRNDLIDKLCKMLHTEDRELVASEVIEEDGVYWWPINDVYRIKNTNDRWLAICRLTASGWEVVTNYADLTTIANILERRETATQDLSSKRKVKRTISRPAWLKNTNDIVAFGAIIVVVAIGVLAVVLIYAAHIASK